MKIEIAYTAFKLSKGTESIALSAGAEQFFKDHGIPYDIILGFSTGDPSRIEYREEDSTVDVPWYSMHMFKDMAMKYNCTFNIQPNKVIVHFNEG